MNRAKLLNNKLGVNIFDESSDLLKINNFSKKEIKKLMIDDLIYEKNKPTPRLLNLTKEILGE